MKAIIIGSGMSGLTAGAYLSRVGYEVMIFEQYDEIGGVTATIHKDGFAWDLGPLLLEGFSPHGNMTKILEELNISDKIPVLNRDRGQSFPKFDVWKPKTYQGKLWRKKYFKELFPEESEGLDKYYEFYDKMLKVNYFAKKLEFETGLNSIVTKLKLFLAFLKIRKYKDWSAAQICDHFFKNQDLKAVFLGILADLVVKPSEFFGLGVPIFNIETAFDKRIPFEFDGVKYPKYYYIKNGCEILVNAFASFIKVHGGKIHTSKKIVKILIEKNVAKGVKLENGKEIEADVVFASGGVLNTFYNLIGKELLPQNLIDLIDNLIYMESVFMVHLGVNMDISQFQPAELCYYYQTSDIEGSIEKMRKGIYHEGNEGFLIYCPSMHSPDMAPSGKQALTIYTVAPHKVKKGEWDQVREKMAEKLLIEAEKVIPNLRKNIETKVILTPEDFKERINVVRHSFGGLAPVMGQQNPPHKTPIKNLWYIGAYSESGGGVAGVTVGTRNAIKMFLKNS